MIQADEKSIFRAAKLLQVGELVAMPTETVYGLAANAFEPQSILKIFEVKGRPQDNPLIVHICRMEMLEELVAVLPPVALRLAERFWPGPLTMILPKACRVPDEVTAGLDTVAVRFPSHPVAQRLIEQADFPLAAPSANLSGRPSPTTAQHVWDDLNGKIPLILDGGSCTVGLESTVVAVNQDALRLLRPGGITPAMLQEVAPLAVDPAVFEPVQSGVQVASPGMKYKHYSPKADVILVEGEFTRFCDYVREHQQPGDYLLLFDGDELAGDLPRLYYGATAKAQAQELFAALRQLDDLGAQRVYARCPSQEGVGLAVYNRLIRAAGFQVVSL